MAFLTDTILIEIIILIVTSLVALFLYGKHKYTYWSKQNVPFLPPTFPFGNNGKVILRQTSAAELLADSYTKFDQQGAKFGGLYFITNPILLIVDPAIVKLVLTKNFYKFQNRAVYSNEEIDPLATHLFNVKIPKWKNLRNKLSPTFSSGKMKMMFPLMVECGNHLENAMDKIIDQRKPIDIKDIMARFTTDVIGSCAFGLDCNSLKDPDAEFRRYGKQIFDFDKLQSFKRTLVRSMPKLFTSLKIPLRKKEVTDFFINITKQTVEFREKNHIERKDFMNLLIKLKNNENVDDDQVNGIKLKSNDSPFTMKDVAAQSYVFFAAGFETSSSTMTFCLYELCMNPDIQDKLRSEIVATLKEHNGEMTYEAIMEMPYMDKVVNESLRKYPIGPTLLRQCTETFQLPDNDLIIEKGRTVLISVLGIHRNPKYYPNPMKFDPERFTEEEKAKRPSYTYLPFGEGPRNCIGKRFGLMQVKVGLAILLKNYKITLNKKTDPKMRLSTSSIVLSVKDGIWLDAVKVN